jgi:SAM-dependent methyltransferase
MVWVVVPGRIEMLSAGLAPVTRLSRARRIVAIEGVGGLVEEGLARLKYLADRSAREVSYEDFRGRDWDHRRGVETEERVSQTVLQFAAANRSYAKDYHACSFWTFREAIGTLWDVGVRPRDFTLVDFGCGKGRALLLGIESGFREVIGLEFAPELADQARENIRSYRGRGLAASVYCCDAASFPIPELPLVAFLFNPFTGPVLEAVAANIRRSYAACPRAAYVVYLGREPNSPFDCGPPFAVVESAPFRAIYRLEAGDSAKSGWETKSG